MLYIINLYIKNETNFITLHVLKKRKQTQLQHYNCNNTI